MISQQDERVEQEAVAHFPQCTVCSTRGIPPSIFFIRRILNTVVHIYCMLVLYSFIRYFIRKDKYAHERGEVFPETNAHVWMNAESAEKNKSEISSGEFA